MNITNKVREDFDNKVEAHIEGAVLELTRLVRSRSPALCAVCTEEVTFANFLAMAYCAKPACEFLDSDDENVVKLLITQPPEASCLGIIIGNDTNGKAHMGDGGTTQSNALIGICTDAVMRALGGILKIVDPLNFDKPLPLSERALVTITVVQRGRVRVLGKIRIERESDGIVVLEEADLKMGIPIQQAA